MKESEFISKFHEGEGQKELELTLAKRVLKRKKFFGYVRTLRKKTEKNSQNIFRISLLFLNPIF